MCRLVVFYFSGWNTNSPHWKFEAKENWRLASISLSLYLTSFGMLALLKTSVNWRVVFYFSWRNQSCHYSEIKKGKFATWKLAACISLSLFLTLFGKMSLLKQLPQGDAYSHNCDICKRWCVMLFSTKKSPPLLREREEGRKGTGLNLPSGSTRMLVGGGGG